MTSDNVRQQRGRAVVIARECAAGPPGQIYRSSKELQTARAIAQHYAETAPEYTRPDWKSRVSAIDSELAFYPDFYITNA